MFQQSVKKYGDNPCLGARTGKNGVYEWLTYKQVDEKVACLGSAMASIGLGLQSHEFVLCSSYDTLGENAIDYIVAHSESSLLFSQSSKLACWQRLFLLTPQVTLLYIGVERMHRY
eukprot:jgi/Picre1/33307/NNA_008631.t1